MEQTSSFEDTIRHEFDTACRSAIKGERIDYFKHMDYRRKNEISFSELTEKELGKLYTMDDYSFENQWFQVLGYDIAVFLNID